MPDETKPAATCATCPMVVDKELREAPVAAGGRPVVRNVLECRQYHLLKLIVEPDFWCSEHPGRALPPTLDEVAVRMAQGILGCPIPPEQYRSAEDVAELSYAMATSLLAEGAKRRGT
jgi:hypothetical protein